jgi:hypothetical protein
VWLSIKYNQFSVNNESNGNDDDEIKSFVSLFFCTSQLFYFLIKFLQVPPSPKNMMMMMMKEERGERKERLMR